MWASQEARRIVQPLISVWKGLPALYSRQNARRSTRPVAFLAIVRYPPPTIVVLATVHGAAAGPEKKPPPEAIRVTWA